MTLVHCQKRAHGLHAASRRASGRSGRYLMGGRMCMCAIVATLATDMANSGQLRWNIDPSLGISASTYYVRIADTGSSTASTRRCAPKEGASGKRG